MDPWVNAAIVSMGCAAGIGLIYYVWRFTRKPKMFLSVLFPSRNKIIDDVVEQGEVLHVAVLQAAELVTLSRECFDNEGSQLTCQLTNFHMTQWVRTTSAARTASALVARLAARPVNFATGA